MPTTVRLSSRFYERFGDEVTNELVGVLNTMDSTYLEELRRLNESNAARFEAKMDAGFSGLRALIAERESTMFRWMIATWIGTLVGLAALLVPVWFRR